LENLRYDTLFLNLPTASEEQIRRIALGETPQDAFERLREMEVLREPEDTQMYGAMNPVLRYLKRISPSVAVHCFRDPVYHELRRRTMVELLHLAARSRSLDLREEQWLNVLTREVKTRMDFLEMDADNIESRSGEMNVLVGASPGMRDVLRSRGMEVRVVEIERSVAPLEVLRREIWDAMTSGAEVPVERVRELVQEHLDFTDLIVRLGLDEAYGEWKERAAHRVR